MSARDPSAVLWTALDAATAVDGTAVGNWTATGVSIDSRTCQPGDLFVALRGPEHDGHDFVAHALARGAVAVMVHRPPPNTPAEAPLLVVDDTTAALEALGRFARLRCKGRVVGVTGSVGKTGTKEAMRLCLEPQGWTYATAGNLNNHWGVPLSLARMPANTEYAVFELGMNHAGEISPLSQLVKPEVAIITAVEAVHLENFESVEGIADAKAEIFDGMSPTSAAILNRDNPHFARLVAHARTQGIGRIWSFGEHAGADARLLECSLHSSSSAVVAMVRGEPIQYALSVPGKHWVMNSLAVLAAARALGADLAVAARQFARLSAMPGRGARMRIRVSRDGLSEPFILLDESYNASPAAVKAALSVLAQADLGDQGRRIVALGDMLELGPRTADLHVGLKEALVAAEVDTVFACGKMMAKLFDALPPTMRGAYAADSAALAGMVAETVRPGDAIMVKGSLGSRMAVVVDALKALDEAPDAVEAGAPRVVNGR